MNKVSKWIIAISVVLPTLLEVIDTSVVNVSLDHIRGSLSAGIDEATWTITAYLVSNAIVIPLTGWFSRFFGRKRYLIFSVILFTVSSFMCGSSRTLSSLVFFRILQGVGGGALQPLSQAILLEAFPPAQYGMAMAMFGIGVMVGPIVGPVLGGWITDNWSWPWIFYINIPLGILSVIMIMLFIRDPSYIRRTQQKIDFLGMGLVAVGIGCLQFVLDKGQREDWFSSALITRFSIISVVCLILFVIVELRQRDPILHLKVFKDISFSTANSIMFIAFFVLFGTIVLLPIFSQQLLGYNSFLSGLVLAPGGVATLITMPIAGKLVSKVNPKAVLFTGLSILGYSTFVMTRFNLYVDFWTIAWSRAVMGFGMGLVFIPLTTMAFATIKKEELGNATSIFNLTRNLAGSFGVAFVTTLLARRAQFHRARFIENLSPFGYTYQAGLHKAMGVLNLKAGAASAYAGQGLVYRELLKQSNLFSFTDAFHFSTVLLICILPLVFLLKQPNHNETVPAGH
ncbi:inner membrane component of tripartite multidrug resistance system [Candidatus Velamenicoccus archaeovorus]|uniref:Inner membrane component of tripartite multidrug resistance system n=1 Tax=Velamenicoccus archaeovorus TaxID=1930593 RepID=A0A410P3G2_VELA1|nr:DHA2 family efflux MFS transporter permease subunit [Candidatus Velamenicoccus archaeovorus]QAT16544.1 inner membrane component of tripartite multidrug resistance system [Candidatus Velamenicoccus archaeovorus]